MKCQDFNPDVIPVDEPLSDELLQTIKNIDWCGNCLDCLYAYIMLLPSLNDEELTAIFGEDLMEKTELSSALEELAGLNLNPNPNWPRIKRVTQALQKVQQRCDNKALMKHFINESIRKWEGDLFEDYFNMSMT